METMKWDSTFEVGDEKIDAEHRIFFGLIQNFIDELNDRHEPARLLRRLREIQKYAEFHFVSEQNLMIEIGFPEVDGHTALHAALLEKLGAASADLRHDSAAYTKFVIFLLEWFSFHTLTEDRKIVDYLKLRA